MQNPSVRRTIDALILNARPESKKLARLLAEFSDHFHDNPELVPYLIRQCHQQVSSDGWICFDLAFANALVHLQTPGGPGFKLPAQLKSLYVRSIIRCCPELNGCFEVRVSKADEILATKIETKKFCGEYGRRIIWPDEPTLPAVTQPNQGEMFEVSE